jgi:hypothetical protein
VWLNVVAHPFADASWIEMDHCPWSVHLKVLPIFEKIKKILFKNMEKHIFYVANNVHYYRANLQCEITYTLNAAKMIKL